VLFLRSIFFTLLFPGAVTLVLPYMIMGGAVSPAGPWTGRQWIGFLLAVAGAVVLVASILDFARKGRGTLAPIDPPKQLVVTGPYRYVRNPMYLGVLTILLGETLFFRSSALLVYSIVVLAMFVVFVHAYEEPTLRRQFGESYSRYARSVRRWIPGRPYAG
jgi:protein-S-isoprenylcysteine O-methyltransferase Ste14